MEKKNKRKLLLKLSYPIIKKINFRYKVCSKHEELSCIPFFIINCGRSGSTLLASILDSHSKIMIPPEQYCALINSIYKFHLYNFIEWLDLINIIIGEFARKEATMNWNLNVNELISELYKLPKEKRSLRTIIDKIYFSYGKQNNNKFKIWGDKTPLNTGYYNFIYDVFPDSKYIGLIRDGRDVINSFFKFKKNIKYAVDKWNESIKDIEKIKKKVPKDKFLLVKYEDLVSEPYNTIENILNFLGFNMEENILKTDRNTYLSKLGLLGGQTELHHVNVKKEITVSSIGKWKRELDPKIIDIVLPQIKDNLIKYGYLS